MSIWNDDCPATPPAPAESTVTLGKQPSGQTAPADGLEVVGWRWIDADAHVRAERIATYEPTRQPWVTSLEPLVLKSAADARDAEQRAEIERLRGLLEEALVVRNKIWQVMVATRACGPDDVNVGRVQAYELCISALDLAITKIGEPR
jgi:hypothetical protein